ncbi:uncharacterized protein C8Q71DRAFT_81623 [Rhodofomes roseus]|uniref:Uncharacterized protein n=1 Tax=Rhodofomes roseus TaxID=34475 RepID=A0ABQ8KF77_9APHY|nr:uncharacterized protein C8Q71DRAFT_81623 [Rhodofomes roseus]KAH9836394.1 hypothetical protein C8Q71DRAFT_81623 [Rhodofomes roseus]
MPRLKVGSPPLPTDFCNTSRPADQRCRRSAVLPCGVPAIWGSVQSFTGRPGLEVTRPCLSACATNSPERKRATDVRLAFRRRMASLLVLPKLRPNATGSTIRYLATPNANHSVNQKPDHRSVWVLARHHLPVATTQRDIDLCKLVGAVPVCVAWHEADSMAVTLSWFCSVLVSAMNASGRRLRPSGVCGSASTISIVYPPSLHTWHIVDQSLASTLPLVSVDRLCLVSTQRCRHIRLNLRLSGACQRPDTRKPICSVDHGRCSW